MSKSNRFFLGLNFGLFGFIFWHLAKEMLQVRENGWFVGQVNLYGDLVFHLGFINKFLESGKIIVESPIFAGNKANYPIFADLATAQIARITGVDFALFITTFLGGFLVVYIARLFILNFFKNEKIVFLALLLFFINGGFGFYYFFRDFAASNMGILQFLSALPNEYTDIKEKGYWWINTYLAYFLPQRGFLFAFPITLLVLSSLYLGFKKGKKHFFLVAGLMAGVLPIIQAHSLFVIFLVTLFFAAFTILNSKEKIKTIFLWGIFATTTAAIATPLFGLISQASNPLEFFRFDPGWTSQENIFWFWLKNLGLFGPILAASLIWLFHKNRHLFILYLPFLAIFIISNIFVFQPWDFDNSKLLVYWFFASTVVVAYFLHDRFLTESLTRRITGVIFVFLMIFSGSLDLLRTFTKVTSYQIFSNADLEVASQVANLTPKDVIFVTAPWHNHPIPALAGRSTLLGFHGWAWSHGLDFQKRAADVTIIYLGGSEADRLIGKYRVSYVAVGLPERSTFSINESYFSKFPSIILGRNWIVYDVSNLWSDSDRQD
ncbi:hypothetical protein HYS90_00790 [Candidatus Curtissbacteria bacterium]|nr:hypothetical protein [Candidatus Curtissbacteria bacterium]